MTPVAVITAALVLVSASLALVRLVRLMSRG